MNRFRAIRRVLALLLLPSLLAGMVFAHFSSMANRPPDRRSPQKAIPRPELPGWLPEHNAMVSRALAGHVDLLFLGDSITRGWLGSGRTPFEGNGLPIWQSRFEPRRAANFGIGSDRIEHLLWRIRHGELSGIDPTVVVLMIGTNNIGIDPPEAIAEGVAVVLDEVRCRLPRAVTLLMALTPRGISPTLGSPPAHDLPNPEVHEVNRLIAPLGRLPRVAFIDFGSKLLDTGGLIPRRNFPDYLHLALPSYEAWAEAIEPTLSLLLGDLPEPLETASGFGAFSPRHPTIGDRSRPLGPPRLRQDTEDRLGHSQILTRGNLEIVRRPQNDPTRMADRLDQLCIVGYRYRQIRSVRVGLAEQGEPKCLRCLHGVDPRPRDRFDDRPVRTCPLQRVGHCQPGEGRAMASRGLEDPIDHFLRRKGPGGVVDSNKLTSRVDPLKTG